MDSSKHSFPLSRRAFVKASGLVAGVLAARPVFSKWGLTGAAGGPLKVGVLAPSSTVHPALVQNLIAGMQLYFDQAGGRGVALTVEPIGWDATQAAQKSRKLIEVDRVDGVVGVVDARVAARLGAIFHESQTPFVASEVGASVPLGERSPYLLYNSLNYWQASRAMGGWAAEHLGKTAFVATSFYDSGYDAAYAFRQGFEAAGGKIAKTQITHRASSADEMDRLIASIEQTQPDFVYGQYCGQPAIDFVQAYAQAGLQSIPLAGSGFMVDESILPAQGAAALGVTSCLPWSDQLDTPGAQAFVTAYQQATGRSADAFAALGYDTAQALFKAAEAAPAWRRLGSWQDAAGLAELIGPRGALQFDSQSSSLGGALYVRQVQANGGALRNAVIDRLPLASPLDEQIVAVRSRQKSGWLNPYLFV